MQNLLAGWAPMYLMFRALCLLTSWLQNCLSAMQCDFVCSSSITLYSDIFKLCSGSNITFDQEIQNKSFRTLSVFLLKLKPSCSVIAWCVGLGDAAEFPWSGDITMSMYTTLHYSYCNLLPGHMTIQNSSVSGWHTIRLQVQGDGWLVRIPYNTIPASPTR